MAVNVLRNRQKLVGIRFGCGLDSRIYGKHKVIRMQNFSMLKLMLRIVNGRL